MLKSVLDAKKAGATAEWKSPSSELAGRATALDLFENERHAVCQYKVCLHCRERLNLQVAVLSGRERQLENRVLIAHVGAAGSNPQGEVTLRLFGVPRWSALGASGRAAGWCLWRRAAYRLD